jgi:hypothetical protein
VKRAFRILSGIIVFSIPCSLIPVPCLSQTVNLVASNTRSLSSLFTGKLCIQPANNSGAVIGFQYGGGGQGVTTQVCFNVTAGVLQSGVTVPDTFLTTPQNLCLFTQLIDPTQPLLKRVVSTLPCLQPASSGQNWCTTASGVTTCNLDNYQVNSLPLQIAYGWAFSPLITLTDAATITLNVNQQRQSAALLMLNASVPYRTINVTGLAIGDSFLLTITPVYSSIDPEGVGFGTGCNWQMVTATGYTSLSNGFVIPPGQATSAILAVTYDGTNCNVTEIQ